MLTVRLQVLKLVYNHKIYRAPLHHFQWLTEMQHYLNQSMLLHSTTSLLVQTEQLSHLEI